MRQIAERAGVNRSTVSLALRDDYRLKPETRERIQAVAAEMGYRRNPTVAQLMTQLRAGQKHHFHSNLALLDFGISHVTPHTELRDGVDRHAHDLGYGLEVFHSKEITPSRLEQILIARGIKGLLITSLWGDNRLPDSYLPLWPKFSCCVIGGHTINPELHFVADDIYSTSMRAVEELRRLGFRRIGLAIHKRINIQMEHRFVAGYLAGHLRHSPLRHPPIHLLEPEVEAEPASRAKFLSWLERVKPQVVVCMQLEILEWIREAGYRVPQDVSVVHLDVFLGGKAWAGMLQKRALWGAAAVDTVVGQINRKETGLPTSPKCILIQSIWQPGDTLGAPPRLLTGKRVSP